MCERNHHISDFIKLCHKMMPPDNEIGANSCCHYELSDICILKNHIHFPKHYIDDYYADFFEDSKIKHIEHDDTCSVDIKYITFEILYKVRTEAYSASVWYSQLEPFTYKSYFIDITDGINNALSKVPYPAFIKLDTVSPKDTGHNCIFKTKAEAIEIFNKSSRVQNKLKEPLLSRKEHSLFVRDIDSKIDNYPILRCFVYQLKLTAVSSDDKIIEDDRKRLVTYIKTIKNSLPYLNSTIDISLQKERIIIIEVNNFGADSPAGAGLFNWKEDYIELHSPSEVSWRHKKYFDV